MSEIVYPKRKFLVRKITGVEHVTSEEIINKHWQGWKAAAEKYFGANDPRVSIDYFMNEWIYCNSASEEVSDGEAAR